MSWWVVVVASVMLIAGRWLQWRPLPSSWRATRRRSQSTARFVARSFRATCSNCQRCWVSMTCQLTATMMTAQPRTVSPPHCPNCRRSASSISLCILGVGWLSSRVVSMLDSGTEGLGFKSQSRRCRVTVLGKLFTPTVPLTQQAAKLVAAVLRVVRVTAGLAETNGSLPPGLWLSYLQADCQEPWSAPEPYGQQSSGYLYLLAW